MLVYVYNNSFFSKISLPNQVNGVYPLYSEDKSFLINIEEANGTWQLTNNKDIVLYENDILCNNPSLKIFNTYIIKNILKNETFFIMATPLYDENIKHIVAKKEIISIGSSENDDICYKNKYVIEKNIILTFNNNMWNLEARAKNVFVLNEPVIKTQLFHGDYIFCNGLKITVINNTLIINNPNNLVTFNSDVFGNIPEELVNENEDKLMNVSEDMPLYTKEEHYLKSPRFTSVIKEEEVIIDEPPEPIKKNDIPVILTIGPQLTMICTSGLTLFTYINNYMDGIATKERFIISITTIGVTITGALLWPTLTRFLNNRRNDKKEIKRQNKYKQYLNEKKEKIILLKNQQKQIMLENNVSVDNCKLIIEKKPRNLWERTIEHEDFLNVRLGIGTVPSKLILTEPSEKFSIEDKDSMLADLEEVVKESKYIEGAPLCLNLTEKNITAIIGTEYLTNKFLECLFLQLMTFHSYTELKIIVFTNEKNANKWEFIKVLPHCWDNQKTIRYFASSVEEKNLVSESLEKVFENRKKEDELEKVDDQGEKDDQNEPPYKKFKPYFLVFTDDIESVRNVPIFKKILNYKKNVGFSLLIQNDRLATLPSETTTFINIDEHISGVIGNELLLDNQSQFKADFNTSVDLYYCAQKLANIPIQMEKAKYELPSSLSFLEMYNVGKIEQLNSLEKWKNNNPVNSLAVPVGIDQNGELFKMDIHEKAAGPHGLVAGTTGSGKSEWIITYILSLAVNFNPDEIQFVLIDYKGGGLAMSFENSEMGIKLPHLAGTITNLDKSEITRAISSIESELKRRQSIFNEAREQLKEGSMNIYKYQQFYRKKMVTEPLSHLLIICDEFAELKQQQPEFMEQLISTSRIGRSLGVHLILATQKPSGVVNDQIWSNSRFKVCLRVQDKSDSNEILKKPDAAYLKQVGAFYLEIGNDEYYNLGQSAWAGAKYFPSDVIKKKIDQSVQYIDNIGRTLNFYDEESKKDEMKESQGEELLNIISYIDKISTKEPFIKKQLWLPNISSVIYLTDIIKQYNYKPEPMNFNTVIGMYDEPRRQEQGMLTINLADGNVGIIGQNGSGKEKLISTIIWSSITSHTPSEINYYIIDFGAETLKLFSKFPHVGEVVFQDDIEKVGGVIELIIEELNKRKELFADYNGSYDFYVKNSGNTLPLIVLVINAYDIFSETIPKLGEGLTTFFRDAPRYGIIFITSVSSATGLKTRQLQYFNHVIVMQMSDEGAYRTITNCRRGLIPARHSGRGICKISYDDNSYCEFQTALIAPENQLVNYVRATADQFVSYYNVKAKQLAKIPDNVTSDDLIKYITDLENVPIGYNFYEKDIAKYNLLSNKIHLITSKDLKSNIQFLYALANLLSKVPSVKVRVIDLLSIFDKPIIDIKLFNEDLEVVFAAIEKDVKTRTETQDYGVNIIIGAGSYKKKLNKAGIEIAQSMFESISASKKNIFILIDNYDKLRTIKLESWYNIVDSTSGIWLGTGINNQSMFNIEEIAEEDRKYDYEGLAFSLSSSKYTVIKTMMDGDE